MKCVYCNQDVDNDARFCPNCGKELPQSKHCSYCGEIIEDDSMFCPNCGKKVGKQEPMEQHDHREPKPKTHVQSEPLKLQGWVKAILVLGLLLLIGYGAYVLFGDNKKVKDDDDDLKTSKVTQVDNDVQIDEQQTALDTLTSTANMKSDTLVKPQKPIQKDEKKMPAKESGKIAKGKDLPRQRPTASSHELVSGSKNFSYGSYKGSLRNGKPHGVNGRLIFKTPHQIDSRDPKGRVAEPGDYVIGEFYEGHLVQGIWYDANNQVKGSIIIGR